MTDAAAPPASTTLFLPPGVPCALLPPPETAMPIERRICCRLSAAALRLDSVVSRRSRSTSAAARSLSASSSASAHVPTALVADDDCRSSACSRAIMSGCSSKSCCTPSWPRARPPSSCSTSGSAGRARAAAQRCWLSAAISTGRWRARYDAPRPTRPCATAALLMAWATWPTRTDAQSETRHSSMNACVGLACADSSKPSNCE
mmetsp:Transcript_65814/g.180476  ORF Transcript_65814/g.180476 Transcript_65814/m.180476 type:complete len:204 (+) Transcript_65814:882-1493(+)